MAQQASLSFRSLAAANPLRILWHLLLQAILAASVSAQTPQQQYVFVSVPVTPATSLIAATNLQLLPVPAQPTPDIASAPIGIVPDPKGLPLYVGLGQNPSTGVQDAGTNVYSIDPVTGALAYIGTAGNAMSAGRTIAIDPQGRFFFDGWGTTLGTIDSALISPADGTALTGISSVTSGTSLPAAMVADGSGKFLYVQEGLAPVVYSVNQTTGALTVSPVPLGALTFSPGR